MARGRFFFTSFLLSAASALGVTYLLRRVRRQPRVELYYDDGSMLAISNRSSELSVRLSFLADELLKQAL